MMHIGWTFYVVVLLMTEDWWSDGRSVAMSEPAYTIALSIRFVCGGCELSQVLVGGKGAISDGKKMGSRSCMVLRGC